MNLYVALSTSFSNYTLPIPEQDGASHPITSSGRHARVMETLPTDDFISCGMQLSEARVSSSNNTAVNRELSLFGGYWPSDVEQMLATTLSEMDTYATSTRADTLDGGSTKNSAAQLDDLVSRWPTLNVLLRGVWMGLADSLQGNAWPFVFATFCVFVVLSGAHGE